MAVRRSFTKDREWGAWSGDLEVLQRIGRTVESLYREHPDNSKSDLGQTAASATIDDKPGMLINVTGSATVNYLTVPMGEEIEYYPFLGMVLVDDERTSGDIEEVLAELVRR